MFNIGSHFESKAHSASLRFPKGLGLIVEKEIKQLLASSYTPLKFNPEIKATNGSVEISNIALRNLSELCLRSTTAKDIILDLGNTKLQYESEIPKIVQKLAWNKILPNKAQLALRVSTSKSRLYHSGLVEEHFKKALSAYGFSFGKKNNSFTTLNITLKENILHLGLSLAGQALNHRGYREDLAHKAPLNECIAASCLYIADQISTENCSIKDLEVHVPFAGSGTFGFEAAMHYLNIAPSLYRTEYALEKLPFTSPITISHTRKKVKEAINKNHLSLHFSDIDQTVIKNLQSHTKSFSAKLKPDQISIKIEQQDFFKNSDRLNKRKEICLLLNPPYGERLKNADNFFKKLAQTINTKYGKHDSRVWGLCLVPAGNSAQMFRKHLQTSNSNSIKLSNGGLAIEAVSFLV